MSNIQLSILIPSIPSRWGSAIALYNSLLNMVGDKAIEIILLSDNKKRSIGAKREALKNLAQGKYFMFCDDDDEFISLDEIYEATFLDVDVIDFKVECKNIDGSIFIVTQKLGNKVEHNTKDGKYLDCNRPPFTNCAWNTRIFKTIEFPDINYAEDWAFIKDCLDVADNEKFIDLILFKYNFNPNITEASTESNQYWTNPNHEKVIKRCIVNVATERYWPGQQRLIESLAGKTDATILTFKSEIEVGAEPHSVNNYSFKPMAILKAYEQGFRQILWLDASMNVISDLKPLFDVIDKDGYFFVDSGWPNSRWTNDKALKYFGTNEGEMLSSGILGLDLTNPLAYQFFDKWTQAMRDGMFNGDWDLHRHDQTCASLIAHKMGMKLQEANTFMVYGKPGNEFITEKTLMLADGIAF